MEHRSRAAAASVLAARIVLVAMVLAAAVARAEAPEEDKSVEAEIRLSSRNMPEPVSARDIANPPRSGRTPPNAHSSALENPTSRREMSVTLLASEPPGSGDEPPPEEDRSPIDARRLLLINTLLPGTAQIALGDRRTGRAILVSNLLLTTVGVSLFAIELVGSERMERVTRDGIRLHRHNGRTYIWPVEDEAMPAEGEWMQNVGLLSTTWSSLLAGYSQWQAYQSLTGGRDSETAQTPSLTSLLFAPYRIENLLNFDFFPVFPLTVLGQIGLEDLSAYARFFRRERVDFWGLSVKPIVGLSLNAMFTLLLVHANSTVEEILYRGLRLETGGVVRSSISFGAAHLPNMLAPGVSIEATLYQTLFATLFGFYAADRTVANGYRLERVIALHFWHNVVAFMLGYMEAVVARSDEQTPRVGLVLSLRM